MSKGCLRAAGRAIAFLLLTAGLLPVYALALVLPSGAVQRLRRLWCRGTCRILGMRLRREGRPFRGCPTLFVANHVSYLDIPALGAFVDGTFIAKAEVAAWPLFGLLSVAEPWVLDCPVAVQAVTLAFVRLADGTPITAGNGDLYAWHGDAALVPHLWNVLKLDGVELRIVLHEPVLSWSVQSRKVLGRELADQIARTLASSRSAACAPETADALVVPAT
jgi:1-acyl-sn-glycerol-3-phosphate acyltransferase